jgi:hypothetical protein
MSQKLELFITEYIHTNLKVRYHRGTLVLGKLLGVHKTVMKSVLRHSENDGVPQVVHHRRKVS